MIDDDAHDDDDVDLTDVNLKRMKLLFLGKFFISIIVDSDVNDEC